MKISRATFGFLFFVLVLVQAASATIMTEADVMGRKLRIETFQSLLSEGKKVDVSGATLLSESDLKALANQTRGLKLEVGAARSPWCAGLGCNFADFNWDLLQETREAFTQEHAHFYFAGAEKLPFSSAEIAQIIAVHFPWRKPDADGFVPRVMDEFKRVLKPGGKILIATSAWKLDWKSEIFGIFALPIAAAQARGFLIEYIVAPQWNAISLTNASP